MTKKKPLEIDMCGGSQLRDTQGETLSIEGADISELESGNGRFNDNHGKGFFNSIGRVTGAKKIFKKEDCDNERQEYYWDKIKAPFIYVKGFLYDDQDHPNARAAAAILRNIHQSDTPLKIKASVEGGVIARGIKDTTLLARTKIHSIALTFTPANNATLVEPLSLDKSLSNIDTDKELIKSVLHLAETNIPSFRHITRHAGASKVLDNIEKIKEISAQLGLPNDLIQLPSRHELIEKAVEHKIVDNIKKIHEIISQNNMDKAMTAGYGGAGAPGALTGGNVIQSESLEPPKGFKFITCDDCGKEQIHHQHQVKCRECNKAFSLNKLFKFLT